MIKTSGQTTFAAWVAQLPRPDSPEAAGHLCGYVSNAKSAATGYGRQTLLAASLAAAAANELVDDIPGADNSEALAEVAEKGAASLAAWAVETMQADCGVGEAVATAEMLAGID